MASLRELITGRDLEKEARTRAGATAFAEKQDPNGTAPEEEGVHEDDFLPSPSSEAGTMDLTDPKDGSVHRTPVAMGTVPFSPSGAGMAQEAEKGESMISKLLSRGVPQEKLEAAAEGVRLNGSHTFTDAAGKPVMTVGKGTQLGQELDDMGKANAAKAASTAPSLDYGASVQTDKTGISRLRRPMQDVRKK